MIEKTIALLLVLTLFRGFGGTAFAGEVNISTTVPDAHTVTVKCDGGRIVAD